MGHFLGQKNDRQILNIVGSSLGGRGGRTDRISQLQTIGVGQKEGLFAWLTLLSNKVDLF